MIMKRMKLEEHLSRSTKRYQDPPPIMLINYIWKCSRRTKQLFNSHQTLRFQLSTQVREMTTTCSPHHSTLRRSSRRWRASLISITCWLGRLMKCMEGIWWRNRTKRRRKKKYLKEMRRLAGAALVSKLATITSQRRQAKIKVRLN
jgi:hypothetical protein